MQLIEKKQHGLAAMYRTHPDNMSRDERRRIANLSPGQRLEIARRMYNEMRRKAVETNDDQMAYTLWTRFYPHIRNDKPSVITRELFAKLQRLYSETDADLVAAHYEDVLEEA